KVLSDGERELQGDYGFTGNAIFTCFKNDPLTLDIIVESEPRNEALAKTDHISEHTSALEESIFRLKEMMMNVKRTQK
ncbi:hypothetical protein GG344DRAFT_13216, partial [Lentinula edodes]